MDWSKFDKEKFLEGEYDHILFTEEERKFINMKGKTIKVKCPKCQRIHKKNLIWKGNGMPRMYCHNCDGAIANIHAKALVKIDHDLNFE
ncbi:MAG: hypothetical protein KatS3mg002_0432 [Candidatus Woesearchaeota archaeon]|nr:MAG: hypothetical protein KatS3mg002_0432 [Candidatus Woesearchaeota archaeon]